MSDTILYALIFAATLMLADVVLREFFGARRKSKQINERLARMGRGTDQLSTYNKLLSDRGVMSRRFGWLSWGWLMKMYRQSGLQMPAPRRIVIMLAILIMAFVFSFWLSDNLVVQASLSVAITVVTSIGIILRLRSRRIETFVAQLPAAIDIIVRSLSAGHPLNAAISLVGREMPDPIGSEFGILSDQLTFGAELDVAMVNMVDRVGADELNLVAVTVSVQRGTGGNLGEVLENLSAMIRDRAMLRAKIRAVSAEGRITGMVMAVFPFLLFFMLRLMVPTYFDPVWESGYGTTVVVTVLCVMSFGIFVLYRLVKFDF